MFMCENHMHLCIHMCVDTAVNVEDYSLGVISSCLLRQAHSLRSGACQLTKSGQPGRSKVFLLSPPDLDYKCTSPCLVFLNLYPVTEFHFLKLGSDLIPN